MSSKREIRRSIAVIGGSYIEACDFPPSRELYGSGARGAAAIPKRGTKVILHTFVDTAHADDLARLAAETGFELATSPIEKVFHFQYRHTLSAPIYFRPRQLPRAPLLVETRFALCYGMMEGQPIVHAEAAVFDPQSQHGATSFHSNGSTVHRLAVIANDAEACTMTGLPDARRAAKRLLQSEKAEVVVIKCGPHGALVATTGRIATIPAYLTTSVYKIGSGDVFSAIFAHAWLIRRCDPVEAARLASLSTAYYCQTRTLPIPSPLPASFRPPPAVSRKKRRAYLAGPFFNPQQLWAIEECKYLLEKAGITVFSPYHHVGLGPPEAVAGPDLEGLREADFLFAILDGFDAGTIFEIGFAVAKKIPVICVYAGKDESSLTMMRGTGCAIYADFASAIYAATAR